MVDNDRLMLAIERLILETALDVSIQCTDMADKRDGFRPEEKKFFRNAATIARMVVIAMRRKL